ncbi:hypothetical protein L6452_08028 [Arctium lappa]|uniref:Uncharacterized protein n=1 Tax=Arctium lappa TaxID=4217 RepID=A0ACB9DGE0_ARCLA|nr:hypothetical protein L6452_08028 [Arctium lappa]
MAVEAVVSVVLQKLTEMLKGQSLTQNKFIIYEVQEIMKSLNSMRDLMTSTKEISPQDEEYLNVVYNVEDTIEKFIVIKFQLKRKKITAVGNHKYIKGCSSNSETQETNTGSYTEELTFSYSCNEEEMQIVGIKERFQKMSSFSYKEEELGIFGLKEDVEILVKQLTTNSERFVSIVSQGG